MDDGASSDDPVDMCLGCLHPDPGVNPRFTGSREQPRMVRPISSLWGPLLDNTPTTGGASCLGRPVALRSECNHDRRGP
jgi:hypothetical protein